MYWVVLFSLTLYLVIIGVVSVFKWHHQNCLIFAKILACDKRGSTNIQVTSLNPEAVVRGCSVKKDLLRKFAKFTGKNLCQSLFLIKLQASRPATLIKTRLWHRCFPVNFAKFPRNFFLKKNTSDGCFCKSGYSSHDNRDSSIFMWYYQNSCFWKNSTCDNRVNSIFKITLRKLPYFCEIISSW